ncbi:MAG: hypothetical protein QOI65_379, partial [Thermoleophilaceae bacterium]|nr:hypothetical protein [Thermoleophilaceae bacterium]
MADAGRSDRPRGAARAKLTVL